MFDLKRFLDNLVEADHPFRKGPNLWEGSALSLLKAKRIKLLVPQGSGWEEQQMRFYFMRINKN